MPIQATVNEVLAHAFSSAQRGTHVHARTASSAHASYAQVKAAIGATIEIKRLPIVIRVFAPRANRADAPGPTLNIQVLDAKSGLFIIAQ